MATRPVVGLLYLLPYHVMLQGRGCKDLELCNYSIGDGVSHERYRLIQQHLTVYDMVSKATVSQEKFVVLC